MRTLKKIGVIIITICCITSFIVIHPLRSANALKLLPPMIKFSQDLLKTLKFSESYIGPVTERRLRRAIEISNSYEYSRLTGDAYDFLIDKGVWPNRNKIFPILFLERLNLKGFAMAPRPFNLIVTGLDALNSPPNNSRSAKIEFLAPKVAHEGAHILNRRYNYPILVDEEIAYRATYLAVKAIGKDRHQIERQRLAYKAFEILRNRKGLLCKYFNIPLDEFENINYSDIRVVEREQRVWVALYLMKISNKTKGAKKIFVDVNVKNKTVEKTDLMPI